VDDVATQELMAAYYERLFAGEGRTEAFRQVQLAMLQGERLSHPYYWTSFIPIGGWGADRVKGGRSSRELTIGGHRRRRRRLKIAGGCSETPVTHGWAPVS
jgi:hypothetical protein